MKRSSIIRISLVLLAVAILAGSAYIISILTGDSVSPTAGSSEDAIPQAVARIGSLTVSVTGTGELVPASTTDLGFAQSGKLIELLVKVGDKVQAGDVLARLQIEKSDAQIASEIASANLTVINAQQALDQIYTNAQMGAAQALTALEDAQQALAELTVNDEEVASAQQALVAAKEQVAEAEMGQYILNSTPSEQDRDIAYASLLFKEKKLGELQDEIGRVEFQIKSAPNEDVRDRLRTQYLNLEISISKQQAEVDNARYKYENMGAPPEALDLSVAQAQLNTALLQVAQAQSDLTEAQAGPTAGELAMAQVQVAGAQAEWERLKNGPDPNEIALAEAQLKKAQAQLAEVEGQPRTLELVATKDGLVTAVNASLDDQVQGQSIVTLADVSQPLINAYFDETDQVNVQVGYRVEVQFEAIPNTTFSGKIVEVNPSLVSSFNTSDLEAYAELNPQGAIKLDELPIGLNATIDVIAGEVNNVVLVPLEALHQLASGDYEVYVVHGQELERRQVTVGLEDYTSAAILDGLSAGEAVAIGDVENIIGGQ